MGDYKSEMILFVRDRVLPPDTGGSIFDRFHSILNAIDGPVTTFKGVSYNHRTYLNGMLGGYRCGDLHGFAQLHDGEFQWVAPQDAPSVREQLVELVPKIKADPSPINAIIEKASSGMVDSLSKYVDEAKAGRGNPNAPHAVDNSERLLGRLKAQHEALTLSREEIASLIDAHDGLGYFDTDCPDTVAPILGRDQTSNVLISIFQSLGYIKAMHIHLDKAVREDAGLLSLTY